MYRRFRVQKDAAGMAKFIFVLIVFLLFIWRIQKGFGNGVLQEIVTILSGAVSLISLGLVFFAISSYIANARSTLVFCIIGLIVMGIIFKLCSLVFNPILALDNIFVIGGLNRIMGAVIGAAEAVILSCLLYFVFDYMGVVI